jgi:hypothetical protein
MMDTEVDLIMPHPDNIETVSLSEKSPEEGPLDDDQPDQDYARITLETVQNIRAQEQAEEERRKAAAPPPDTRTAQEKAEHLRQFADSFFLQASMRSPDGPIFDVQTFKVYLDDLLNRAGASSDPIEQMLVQQLAQAHFAIGRLHVRASGSRGTVEAVAYTAAAARLMAEFRRTSLALQAYRETAARKQVQEAKASTRHRRKKPPVPAAEGRGGRSKGMPANTELGSNASVPNRLNGYFREPEPAHT